MKRKIIVTAVFVVLIIGAGVAYAVTRLSERQPEPEIGSYSSDYVKQFVSENLSDKDNIIVPCYKENDLLYNTGCFSLGRDAGTNSASGFRTDLFERIVKMFPDPLIREEGNYIYAVYDTDISTRLFLFFSIEKSGGMFLDGFPVIMKEKLSYSDFAGLKAGDDIKIVEGIDPVVTLYTGSFDSISDNVLVERGDKFKFFTTIHLLSDGILKIEYERESVGNYIIKDIIFAEDFALNGANGETNYKIAAEDYITGSEEK